LVLGLVATIRSLCRELTQGYGLPIEFTSHEAPAAIPEDTALCLYRIVQEALRNTIKHSGARHAGVELSGSADAIALRIVDDGTGFEPGSVESQGGLGLLSMRERLYLVGGAITIDSRPSNGTRIDVSVPLGTQSPAEDAAQDLQNRQDGELDYAAARRGGRPWLK
jgi:signal transduction histidine kinase